jgi:flagellar biosynthesis protein FlhA
VEQLVIENVRQTELGTRLILDPKSTERLLIGIRDQMETMSQMGYSPIALCSPRIRMYVRSLVEQNFPMLTVLSYAEIAPGVDVESLGMVTVNYED